MKFLVAVDGSQASTEAARFASTLVKPTDHITVFSAPKDSYDVNVIEQATSMFGALVGEKNVLTHTEPQSNPRDSILARAKEEGSDVIVLGARGVGALTRAFGGSVSRNVVHSADRPVLVVHREQLAGLNSFVVCLDGSDASIRGLKLTLQLVKKGDLLVLWTSFVPPSLVLVDEETQIYVPNRDHGAQVLEKERQAKAIQQQALEVVNEATGHSLVLQTADLHIRHVTQPCYDPAAAIVEFADGHSLQTIVCGTRGIGPVRRALLGSFSDSVITNAHKHAILVVP